MPLPCSTLPNAPPDGDPAWSNEHRPTRSNQATVCSYQLGSASAPCQLADNDDALLLKRMGITSLSFLHGHRAFLRIERKKLSLAVVKACISIKLNELYGAQNQCAEGSDESKRVRNETDRYTDLKNQFKGEDEDGDEDGDDEEEEDEERELGRLNGVLDGASGGGGNGEDREWMETDEVEAGAAVAKCPPSKTSLEKLLVEDPIFRDAKIISAINWQDVSKNCVMMGPRTLNHLKFSWNHIISPLTNTNPWRIDEKRLLKDIVKNLLVGMATVWSLTGLKRFGCGSGILINRSQLFKPVDPSVKLVKICLNILNLTGF